MNRVIYKFNDKADQWVLVPVAKGYKNYTPGVFQRGVDNFFNNLNDANSALNHALQGDGKASLYNFSRFLINSTIGLLGMIDVVGSHDRSYDQTGFGDTFARWGWENSSYLVMPLFGPSTLRDGAGTTGDVLFRQHTFYTSTNDNTKIALGALEGVNTRSKLLGIEDTINGAALDPYSYTRDAWLQIRAKQLGIKQPQLQEEDDFDIDDLL